MPIEGFSPKKHADEIDDKEFGKCVEEYKKNQLIILQGILLDSRCSKLVDSYGNTFSINEVKRKLSEDTKVLIVGERGLGKTNVVKNIYRLFLLDLQEKVDDGKTLLIPVYIKLEQLWDCKCLEQESAIAYLCDFFKIPYTSANNVKYVFLFDGEMQTTQGYLPPILNQLLEEKNDRINVLISHITLQILNPKEKVLKLTLKKLSFREMIEIVHFELGKNNKNTFSFFDNLFKKAFEGVERNTHDHDRSYRFKTIAKIYEVFKARSKSFDDDFYSITLAESTQKGRLPKGFNNDEEILIWRKLIIGNEVFHAMRNPYYLKWVLKLYLEDKKQQIPYKLKTLQVRICQSVLQTLPVETEIKRKVIECFLLPLAKCLHKANESNKAVCIKSFSDEVNNTNFDRIKDVVLSQGLINIANEEIVFSYDFFYDYFWDLENTTDASSLASSLLTCKKSELFENFVEYIQRDEVFKSEGIDAIELAADMVIDEYGSLKTTSAERKKLLTIMSRRYAASNNYKQKASILNGVGKLFCSHDLISDENFFDIKSSSYWIKLREGEYISRFPITYYQYNMFVEYGYENQSLWEYGQKSLRLSDGSLRTRPLKIDQTKQIFEISNHPVVGITWYEAKAFCKWLNQKIGETYEVDLPFCCQVEAYLDEETILKKEYNARPAMDFVSTTPVSIFASESSKPCDILGNVWEWSGEIYDFHNDLMVTCYGGCWSTTLDENHLYTKYPAKLSSNNVGFRVVIKLKDLR